MPDHDGENHPLTSSKKSNSLRFRRLSISSKRRSELKATISGPHAFGGGGASTISLGDVSLRALNNTLLHPNPAVTVTNGLPPSQPIFARGLRRNSDIPLGQHRSNSAWPTNHPEITPGHGSPHHPHRTTCKKPPKADISRPLVPDSSRSSFAPGIFRKRTRRSTQTDRRPRFSGSMASSVPNGNSDEGASRELSVSVSDGQLRVSNLLNSPSDKSDPRAMIESYPVPDLDLNTSTASFGSVKQRTRKIDKALRASRTALLPVPQENAKPDLVYTDDSDAFPSPPSTPSTPVWEATTTSPIPKTDLKLATELDLADVHAQIQAMIDSANCPSSSGSGDFPTQGRPPSNTYRTDIPPSLRPSNPMHRSFPRLTTAHRRSASSPPLGLGTHYAHPPDLTDRLLYRPVTPVARNNTAPPISPPSKTTVASPTSATTPDLMTPATPTKKSFSERSDSPSVYSQQSPSQVDNFTPTSSNASSPNHPYAKNKHERLLAAISEGISPTKPGPTALSIRRSSRRRDDKPDSRGPPLHIGVPAVPVIVVTDPNDDDLVYSESSFSIVDMYAGPAETSEAGLRRRTRTANSVSHVNPR